MRRFRLVAAVTMGLGVSACATVETATRNTPLDTTRIQPIGASFDVQGVTVQVPRALEVSESNRYYPGGDIVWREDPVGDRHEQVRAIFEEAMNRGVDTMPDGSVPARLDIEVSRFHALTEKARYTVGGVHALQFTYVLRNPETGEAYGPPKKVKADLKAYGGARAIAAEREGITQKYRITNHLAEVIRRELGDPEGYTAAKLGLMGAINQI